MVKAILEGKKTQTRRIIQQKYENADIEWFTNKYGTRLIYRQNDADEPITMPDGTTRRKLVAIEEIKQMKIKVIILLNFMKVIGNLQFTCLKKQQGYP